MSLVSLLKEHTVKSLIIAEKSSVAADIANVLGNFKKTGGFFERDDMIVVGAVGHLLGLQCPPGQDVGIPVIPTHFELVPIETSADRLALVESLIARRDVAALINCCDAGREGELIFRYIYSHSGTKKPIKRMWLQSMTPDAIKAGYDDLKDGAAFDNLYDAAVCRSESDWLMGINGSRCLTWFNNIMYDSRDMVTAGRVQTPVVTIVADRENEILNFVPRPYWEAVATFAVAAGEYNGKWIDPAFIKTDDDDAKSDRLFDTARATAVLEACVDKPVQSVIDHSQDDPKPPPKLFDLTSLQREANRKFGFTASQTLGFAQSLYETHKVLTYPRTDATALPEDYLVTVANVFGTFEGVFAPLAKKALANGYVKLTKRIFDNSKISDHFAIIPTGLQPVAISADEMKIYDLVARRFIGAFYPAALFKKTIRETVVNNHTFKSNGTVLVDPGWLEVSGREAGGDNELAYVAEWETPDVSSISSKGNATKPPKRFTEDTLLGAMEGAGRYVEDDERREALKGKGLGTPATRAAIIEGLMQETERKKPYFKREGKEIRPTPKAMHLIPMLREHGIHELCSPAMTGEWEMRLRNMEKGAYPKAQFMTEITDMVRSITEKLQLKAKTSPQYAALKLDVPCPVCKGEVREEGFNFLCSCGFKIGRKVCGRDISKVEVTALLKNGKSPLLKGFTSPKTSKVFDAFLTYSKTENKLEFTFPQAGEHDGSCPKCKEGQLKQKAGANGPFWYCTRWNADLKCDATYKDDNGQPLVAAPILCPKCRTGRLRLVPGQEKPFWSCSNYRNETAQCKGAFPDRGGVPDFNPPPRAFKPSMKKVSLST
jgi:DNA topoisomerase-3